MKCKANKGYDEWNDYKGSEEDYERLERGKKAITLMFSQLNKKLDELVKLTEQLLFEVRRK